MTRAAATPWDAFIAKSDSADRVALLPGPLRRSLAALVEAACDLSDEAYTTPFDAPIQDKKVQTSKESGLPVGVKNGPFADHLRYTLPRGIDDLRATIGHMLATGQKPRSGPRFRRRRAGGC